MITIIEQGCLLRYVQIEGVELVGLGPGADRLDEIGVDALFPEIFEFRCQGVTNRLEQAASGQHA
ncbi:MAG: hypothetical protein ACE14P_06495 [Methanotrichaceae archaeon]